MFVFFGYIVLLRVKMYFLRIGAAAFDDDCAQGLKNCIYLAKNAKIVLTSNVWPEAKLVNGAQGRSPLNMYLHHTFITFIFLSRTYVKSLLYYITSIALCINHNLMDPHPRNCKVYYLQRR